MVSDIAANTMVVTPMVFHMRREDFVSSDELVIPHTNKCLNSPFAS